MGPRRKSWAQVTWTGHRSSCCCEIRRSWPSRDMERSFYPDGCCLALARAGFGLATCWPCRDRVPHCGGVIRFASYSYSASRCSYSYSIDSFAKVCVRWNNRVSTDTTRNPPPIPRGTRTTAPKAPDSSVWNTKLTSITSTSTALLSTSTIPKTRQNPFSDRAQNNSREASFVSGEVAETVQPPRACPGDPYAPSNPPPDASLLVS